MASTYPDLKRCHKPCAMPPYAQDLNCCPPYKGETPKKFEFPQDLPMRTRLAAHSVGKEYMAKYSLAVQLMKDLPPEDPRNFMQQANVHCAYCNGAYYMGETDKPFKVHGGWFFLPWHRWYLYFYERILAKLLGDDTFALPFWNWDLDEGMTIPPMYMDKSLSLFDDKRNPDHANALVDLGYSHSKWHRFPKEDLVSKNYWIMRKQIVILGISTRTFHGEPIREDSKTCTCGAGTLEYEPHNTVHDWTGRVNTSGKPGPCPSKTCYGEDMGILYSAARDPIFFAHHANVDRIWTIWKTLPGLGDSFRKTLPRPEDDVNITKMPGREDYDDPDLLDTLFYFYDENACLVEVRAGDAFDTEKLRYKYEDKRNPWLEIPRMVSWSALPTSDKTCSIPTLDLPVNATFSEPVKISVAREPPPLRYVELLVIEGIRVQRNIAVKFDVFVQLDDCRVATSYVDTVPPEYVGTFVELPRGAINDVECRCGQSSMRVVISEVLRDLGVGEDEKSIVVTFIPKVDLQQPIQISAVRIENEALP